MEGGGAFGSRIITDVNMTGRRDGLGKARGRETAAAGITGPRCTLPAALFCLGFSFPFSTSCYRHCKGDTPPHMHGGRPCARRKVSSLRWLTYCSADEDEIAYNMNNENAHYGTHANPCAPGRISGESSSGSAVAVTSPLAPTAAITSGCPPPIAASAGSGPPTDWCPLYMSS